MRLLLIEDDEVDAKWVERALKGLKKFSIARAESLAAGLQRLKTEPFDIILSDLQLPDAGGLEVFYALSQHAPHLPLVVLTGNIVDEDSALEAVQKGAQDYLIKGSIQPETLLRSLDYAVERKKLLLLRDHVVHVVSHELSNPLATLKLALFLVKDGTITDEKIRKETLDMAVHAIDRLIRTTGDLLNLARMESRQYVFQHSKFNLNSLIQEVGEFFQLEIQKKGLVFKTACPDREVEIFADRDQIVRVFTNLISNALKFTAQGHIEIRVEEEKDFVRCSVADTGPGISKEDMPKPRL